MRHVNGVRALVSGWVLIIGASSCRVSLVGYEDAPTSGSPTQQIAPLPAGFKWIGLKTTGPAWTLPSMNESHRVHSYSNGFKAGSVAAHPTNGNLYVADEYSGRIVKVSPTGEILGWIGRIGSTPTGGDPGCTSAITGAFTPGWCTGGTASFDSTGPGFESRLGLIYDSGSDSLVVADTLNHRISWFAASSGTYLGSVGEKLAGTSGTCSASSGPVVSRCTGAQFMAGNADGAFTEPSGLVTSGAYLYVTDRYNYRVVRLSASDGSFQGAVGYDSVGGFPAAWTTGGTFVMNDIQGFLDPRGISADSSGNLYVADAGSHKAVKLSASGAWVGALGNVNVTGGTCVSTGFQGWCDGGLFSNTTATPGDGTLFNPEGILVDTANSRLIVSSTMDEAVSAYDLATGTYIGSSGFASSTLGTCVADGITLSSSWCTGGSFIGSLGISNSPSALALNPANGRIWVVTTANGAICQITPSGNSALPCLRATATTHAGWSETGSTVATETGSLWEYELNQSSAVAIDPVGDLLYVTDEVAHRVLKYQLSSGVLLGWIGTVGVQPTGGASGCATTGSGTYTPGWCLGGRSGGQVNATSPGFSAPKALRIDRANDLLYVLSATSVSKIRASTGAHLGSIGRIQFKSGSGANPCTAANNAFSGQWCTGAYFYAGTAGDGSLSTAAGMDIDVAGDFLYVASSDRLNRYQLSTGAYLGSVGSKGSGSTGTCPASSGPVPGWCTGAIFGSGNSDGAYSAPTSLAFSRANDSLYVGNGARIIRVAASTGAFVGSVGYVSSSTGTCVASAVASTWCQGGTFSFAGGYAPGAFDVRNLAVDPQEQFLYVSNGSRLQKLVLATGQVQGWMGQVGTAPTGGGSLCTLLVPGSFASTWCEGGAGASLFDAGVDGPSIREPRGLAVDAAGTVYYANGTRVIRFVP